MKILILTALLALVSSPAYAAFPTCGSGKFETRYSEVSKMLKLLVGFNAGSKSLLENASFKGKARASYWLLNKNGVAQLRMKASIDVSRSAKACQRGNSVVLTAGGYTSTLTRKGSGIYMTYDGRPDWNNLYAPAAF